MITMLEAVEAYTAGNNMGVGYAPDQASVSEAVESLLEEGGELVLEAQTTSDVTVVLDSAGQLVAIGGDGMGVGAWAVVIGGAS